MHTTANGYGIAAAQQNYQSAASGLAPAGPPKTITSAIGRVETLNERLDNIRSQVANLSDMIGGPRTAGETGSKSVPSPIGVVYRLNDAADHAHSSLDDIESLLSSIGRALG